MYAFAFRHTFDFHTLRHRCMRGYTTITNNVEPAWFPLPERSDNGALAHLSADQMTRATAEASPAALQALEAARSRLADDEVVAIPTETVYGLAANALSPIALAKIFQAKNRPLDNPLIVHVSSLEMLASLLLGGIIPEKYTPFLSRFWPGPLTLLFPANTHVVPRQVTAGLKTVAVRMPAHPVARHLIAACGFPLAAPSANSSGKPSPTLADHVLADLNGKISLILNGGQCDYGLESTVLDLTRTPPVILRPGSITVEMLRQVPGYRDIQMHDHHNTIQFDSAEVPLAPGMKYRHYCPDAPMLLLLHPTPQGLADSIAHLQQEGASKIGVLRTQSENNLPQLDELESSVIVFDATMSPARELFKGLRWLDEMHVDAILVEGVNEYGEGVAVMNRLRKAARAVI